MKTSCLREGAAVFCLLILTAMIFTLPLVLHLESAIPSGYAPQPVAKIHLFTAKWTAKVLDSGGAYWNPQFFHPFKGVFAWLEPLPLTGFLVWLISKVTGFISAYNIVVILYLAGLGWVGYRAVRLFTEDRIAASLCGAWLTAGAASLQQISALVMMAAVFPCAAIYCGFVYFRGEKLRFLWYGLFWYLCAWFSTKQLAVFLTVLIPFIFWPFISKRLFRLSFLGNLALALTICGIVLYAYIAPQIQYLSSMGFERNLERIIFVLSPKNLWGIGIICTGLIFVGFVRGAFSFKGFTPFQKKAACGISSMVALAFTLGIGPGNPVYAVLYKFVPGFKLLRTPDRFAIYIIFGFAVGAAFAFAHLRKIIVRPLTKKVFSICVFMFLAAEMWTMPIPLVYLKKEIQDHAAVVDWLRQKVKGRTVLELPMPETTWSRDREVDVGAMERMLLHGNPVVNGYTSFTPQAFKQLRRALVVEPKGQGVRYLAAYGVSYIVVHNELLTGLQRDIFPDILGKVVYTDFSHTVYEFSQDPGIRNAKEYLPRDAEFRKAPVAGKYYALVLTKPLGDPLLLTPQSNWKVKFTWRQKEEEVTLENIEVRGAVILDNTDPEIGFRLLQISKNKAIIGLISREEKQGFF